MASGNGHGGRGRPSMLRLRSAGAARRKSPGRDVKALPSRERRVRDGARSGGTAPERALPWSSSDSSAVRLEREDGRVPARPCPARSMAVTRRGDLEMLHLHPHGGARLEAARAASPPGFLRRRLADSLSALRFCMHALLSKF